jgi:hypothetical protein
MSARTSVDLYSEIIQPHAISTLKKLLQLAETDSFRVNVSESGKETSVIKGTVSSCGVCDLYKPDRTLYIDCAKSALADRLEENVKNRISSDILGEHYLHDVGIIFGKHKLMVWNEEMEKVEKRVLPYARLELWGYEKPRNWTKYKESIVKLDVVSQLVVALESIIGKTEIYFSYNY